MKEGIERIDPAAELYTPEKCYIIELSNTADDPEVSIARARVELGARPPQDVSEGDVVLIPSECRQRITNTGQTDLIFLAICTPRFTQECYESL